MSYSRVLQQLFFVHALTRGCVSCVPLWVSFALCVLLCVVPGGAAVSVEASFNDSRCVGQMVCPNDPLLYTCTVKNSQAEEAVVHLPAGQMVVLNRSDIIRVEGDLPDGVIVDSHYARVDYVVINYCIALIIERASLLNGSITCDGKSSSAQAEDRKCQIATEQPAPPEQLHQDDSAKIETSAVVQWKSPAMTGGSGVTISEYIVTVDGNMYQTIRYYGGDVLATIITGVANKHTVSVKSKNSCGLSSQPATTTVFKLLPDQPAPSHPLLYCIGSKNKGASWKVDVGVVYPRDAHVDMKPTVVNGSCSKNGPVSELIPQKEEQVNPVAFCYFTVAGVEDELDPQTPYTCGNGREDGTLSRGVVATIISLLYYTGYI